MASDLSQMPVATPEIYAQMLDTAKEKHFAFPAINVSSSQTLNAASRIVAMSFCEPRSWTRVLSS